MANNCYHWSFASDFHHQRVIVKSILGYIEKEIPSLSESDLFDLRVILNELITNAIIHGHKMDITKKVRLSIELNAEAIKTSVRDEGIGFDYSCLSEEADHQTPTNIFDEHGRGLQLVLSLVDNVTWNSSGNEVVFYKYFNRHNNSD